VGGVARHYVNRLPTPLKQLLMSDLRLNATAQVLKQLSSELGKAETQEKLAEARRHVEEAEAVLGDVLDSIDESNTRPH